MRDPADLSRDVIKSDTAEVAIPELDLHITTGSLGGLITTVEGLATSVQVRSCIDPWTLKVLAHCDAFCSDAAAERSPRWPQTSSHIRSAGQAGQARVRL